MMEWISVKDRLPEINELVLAFTGWGNFELCIYQKDGYGDFSVYEVTHWMPLPPKDNP